MQHYCHKKEYYSPDDQNHILVKCYGIILLQIFQVG